MLSMSLTLSPTSDTELELEALLGLPELVSTLPRHLALNT